MSGMSEGAMGGIMKGSSSRPSPDKQVLARSPSMIVFSFLASPITLIGFGILLRTVQYAANPSLWGDESALALNIIQRTYVDLLQPLDYGQAAPVGFLLLEKFVSLRLGIGEYALRLIPFLSGITSLFLFHALAKRCLVREAIPWALFLFAIASPLVYYSSELKQYSSDVFITLVILLAGFRAREKNLAYCSVAMFGAAGAAGIWFSQPATFVAGGVALALVVSCVARKDWGGAGLAGLAGTLFLLSFGAEYHFLIRNIRLDHFLEFWSRDLMPFPPSSPWHLLWIWDTFILLFFFPMGLDLKGLGAFSFLCGAISMLKRNRDTLFILFFPALVTIVASALQRYPLRGRLVLFLAPFLAMFMAEGIIQVFDMGRAKRLSAGVLFVVLLFLQPLADAAVNVRYPEEARSKLGHSEEIRPVLWYIQDHWREGDLMYVFDPSEDAFRYYSLLLKADFREVIIGKYLRKDFENTYRKDLDRLRGRGRVWVLFSHVSRGGRGKGVNVESMVGYLETIGKRRDQVRYSGAFAYLFDLTASSERVKQEK
jgi:hypothetical protein